MPSTKKLCQLVLEKNYICTLQLPLVVTFATYMFLTSKFLLVQLTLAFCQKEYWYMSFEGNDFSAKWYVTIDLQNMVCTLPCKIFLILISRHHHTFMSSCSGHFSYTIWVKEQK